MSLLTVPLKRVREFREDAELVSERDPVVVIDVPDGYLAEVDGRPIGYLSRRELLDALDDGAKVFGAFVSSVDLPTSDRAAPQITVSVFFAKGIPSPEAIAFYNRTVSGQTFEKSYPVGLSGESHYQDAIGRCVANMPVTIAFEYGNAYDKRALVVLAPGDQVIGYIPRDHWLKRAIWDEGKGCSATIEEIAGLSGKLGVILRVTLDSTAIGQAPPSLALARLSPAASPLPPAPPTAPIDGAPIFSADWSRDASLKWLARGVGILGLVWLLYVIARAAG